MSQENVETLRAGYEGFSRTGTLALELLVPDVTAYDPPDGPDPRVYQGREGLLQQLQNVADAFDELRWDVEELIDADDKVVVATQMGGRGKESEAEVSVRVFHVWTMRDG